MGNEHRRVIRTDEEQDVHTACRKMYVSLGRPGATSRAKRRTRRRERREEKREVDQRYLDEYNDLRVRGWYDFIVSRSLDDDPMSEQEAVRLGRHCLTAWIWWSNEQDD